MKPHIYFDGEKWQWHGRTRIDGAQALVAYCRVMNEKRAMAYFTK